MNGPPWWDVVTVPADIIDLDPDALTLIVADPNAVYIVNLRTNEIMEGPL